VVVEGSGEAEVLTDSMDTFTASQTERHPTDMAMLRGARLVTAQETEEGRYWAESKIKSLTGGDPVTARFMRQDFFTYQPTFKLVIVGNHRPGIRNVDDAMRRRLHLIPFTYKPPRPDKDLPERLRAERPGILAWAVQGCLEWQRVGLAVRQQLVWRQRLGQQRLVWQRHVRQWYVRQPLLRRLFVPQLFLL